MRTYHTEYRRMNDIPPIRARKLTIVICRRFLSAALGLSSLLVPTFVTTGLAEAQIYTVLYSFSGGRDGGHPEGTLAVDTKGNLYGTTTEGGDSIYGTVFKVDPTGKETCFTASLDREVMARTPLEVWCAMQRVTCMARR